MEKVEETDRGRTPPIFSSSVNRIFASRHVFFLAILFFGLLLLANQANAVDMADCFEASTNSEFYQLTNSITSTTTCINITAYNVTINGNWFTVEYGNQASPSFFAGINISGYGSATIENITIVRGAAAANTVARVSLYANSTRNISISNIEMQDARNALVLYSVINASISNISIADVSAKAVWVEGQNISLRDFTIDSAFTSMHINNSIGINISDITITSSNDAGIQVQNTSAGNWHNVSLDGSSTYALWANNISNMLLQNISAQFQLYAAYINASTNVTFNSLYANFSDLYSVQVAYSNAVRFIQSQIQNTGTGYADLKISGASNFTVINDTTLYNLSLQSARFVLVNTTSGRIDTIGTVTADLVPFWDQIVFDDNLVQINESLINTSANITLTSVPIYENPAINKDGRECFDPYCVNLTALDQATVQFNISSMGDYSIEESASITSCGTLSRDNFGYRLESDLNATGICLILDADNITINGQGYTITGDTTSQALQAVSHTNITFANITLRNVSQAIDLDDITNSTFSNITILNATQSVYAINAQDSSFVNFTARNTSGFFLNASTGLELANIYVVNASIAIELNQTTDSTFENITSSQIIMSDDSQDNTLINVSYTSGTFGSATFVEEQYFYIRAIDSASSLLSNASIVIENASTTVFTGETSGASEGYASVRAQLIRAYSNSTLDNTYQITATLPGFSDVVKNIVLNQTNGAYSVQFSGIGACAAISNSATYTLRQNIYTNGSCFNITADTVTINGNGFGVYGGFANITGFDIQADDVTLTGLTISQFNRGIHIPQTVQGFILEDSTLEDNYYAYADNASTDSTIENVAFVNSTHVLKLNGTTDGLSIINTTINLQLSTAIAFNQSVQTQDTLFDEVDIIHTNGSLTNISGTVDGLYEIGVISTYYQIGITNLSLVRFKRNINATNLDLDSDILFAYNYFKLNDTRQSQMNKTANITLYALNEGSQRSIIRNNVLCDEDTTPGCTEGTSIDSSPFTFNVSDFRNASNYSVRGFVVKLNYPELDDRVRQDDIQFQFNATPAYGSILDNCSFQINDVEYDSFSRAELSAKSTFNVTVRYLDVGDYSWEVFCDDNASLRQNATSNFSVRSSGGGGGGGSSGTIGLNGNSKWWVNTFEDDATNLTQVTHYLRALDGIRIRVKGESHHVGVVYLTSTMATINISSKTQQINLTVNETRRIDLDEDNESDIRVTLHEISKNTAGSLQANVSVVSVVPGSPGTDYVIPEFAPVTNNSQTQENMTIVATQGGSSGPTGPLNPAGKKKNTQLVVILVVFTLGASIYAVMKSNAKKSENKIEEMKPREKVLTAVPLMDPHLYQSLAATYTTGQSIESMKFHLFERGYSRENADQIMNQFMLDHYVKTALEHGLKPEQIREALRAAGWPEYLLSQVFYEQEK